MADNIFPALGMKLNKTQTTQPANPFSGLFSVKNDWGAATQATPTTPPATGTMAGGFFPRLPYDQSKYPGMRGEILGLLGTDYDSVKNVAKQTSAAGGVTGMYAGIQMLEDFMQGKLSPAMEAKLSEFQSNRTAGLKRLYSQAGLSDSTTALEDEADIGEQMLAMRAGMLQINFQAALQAMGLGGSLLGSAAQTSIAQWAAQAQSGGGFMEALFGGASALGSILGGVGGFVAGGPAGAAAGASIGGGASGSIKF